MKLMEYLEALLQRLADVVCGIRSRAVPRAERLAACRIVSHRGEHDNRRVMENSLEAFAAAARAGVWGIEFDIRWTRDQVPVVFHDPDLKRLFGCREALRSLSRLELAKRFPLVPSLEEVVAQHGGRRHMMIELKGLEGAAPNGCRRALKQVLSGLEPARDYHLLSLVPGRFAVFDWAPAEVFLPIGRLDLRNYSRLALTQAYGGLTGHYLLLSDRLVAAHHRRGQKVGTGFPADRNVFFREIHRGVDWIFSNRAAALQALCRRYAGGDPSSSS